MVLKLVGFSTSNCTRRVAIVLAEKNVPFEFISVDWMNGALKSPEFLEKQPFGQAPYIDDDGFILFESRAICRYIAAKYPSQGTSLLPTEAKALAKFEEAASIETANFDPYASGAIAEKLFKPYLVPGGTTDKVRLAELLKTLDDKLEVYDIILGKQQYIAGDEITLIDLFHLPAGAMLATAGINIMESRPNVARWWKEITSRPSWQSVKDQVSGTA